MAMQDSNKALREGVNQGERISLSKTASNKEKKQNESHNEKMNANKRQISNFPKPFNSAQRLQNNNYPMSCILDQETKGRYMYKYFSDKIIRN